MTQSISQKEKIIKITKDDYKKMLEYNIKCLEKSLKLLDSNDSWKLCCSIDNQFVDNNIILENMLAYDFDDIIKNKAAYVDLTIKKYN